MKTFKKTLRIIFSFLKSFLEKYRSKQLYLIWKKNMARLLVQILRVLNLAFMEQHVIVFKGTVELVRERVMCRIVIDLLIIKIQL